MNDIKCLFGLHDWKNENFWYQIIGANGNKLHPIKYDGFIELKNELKKDKIPNDWFPSYRNVCKRCGKKSNKIKIDSLYEATKSLYPKFEDILDDRK